MVQSHIASPDRVKTLQKERRGESGAYLLRYAQEATWREDNRRLGNGEQVNRMAGLALASKPSVDFCGYWQRHNGNSTHS